MDQIAKAQDLAKFSHSLRHRLKTGIALKLIHCRYFLKKEHVFRSPNYLAEFMHQWHSVKKILYVELNMYFNYITSAYHVIWHKLNCIRWNRLMVTFGPFCIYYGLSNQ